MSKPKTKASANWGGARPHAGRPKLEKKLKRVPASIQIPGWLKDAIQKEADRDEISFSRAAENRLRK